MKILASLLLAHLSLVFSCFAGSFDLASLPDLQRGEYKADPYIAASVDLQGMGRDAACQSLMQAAMTNREEDDRQIIVICRMLFTKKPTGEFRRPMIGAASFFGETDYSDWPLEPIEIIDGVPFAITRGYMLGGRPEAATAYLDYCMTNCDWNTFHFHVTTSKQKRAALAKLVTSSKWKRALNSFEKDFFSAQIE